MQGLGADDAVEGVGREAVRVREVSDQRGLRVGERSRGGRRPVDAPRGRRIGVEPVAIDVLATADLEHATLDGPGRVAGLGTEAREKALDVVAIQRQPSTEAVEPVERAQAAKGSEPHRAAKPLAEPAPPTDRQDRQAPLRERPPQGLQRRPVARHGGAPYRPPPGRHGRRYGTISRSVPIRPQAFDPLALYRDFLWIAHDPPGSSSLRAGRRRARLARTGADRPTR